MCLAVLQDIEQIDTCDWEQESAFLIYSTSDKYLKITSVALQKLLCKMDFVAKEIEVRC